MRSRTLVSSVAGFSALAGLAFIVTAARREPTVAHVDFGKVVTATQPAYDARVSAVADPSIKEFVIPISRPGVLTAVAFALVVGLAFGWYPARRAAKLDPIQAMNGL